METSSLTALVAYMKSVLHASYSSIRKYLRDVVKINISRGQLRKLIGKVSKALDAPYEQLLRRIPFASKLNVDETGHKENGDKFWTWCFRAELYVLFKIDKSRGSKVLSMKLRKIITFCILLDILNITNNEIYKTFRRSRYYYT